MASRQTSSRFHTTSWTLVRRAESSREALEVLLAAYWSPVYAYLRCKGRQHADASDLTQGFLTKVVEKRDLITKADPDRGRFRTFLLSSLDNFVVDRLREESGRSGTRPRFVPDDPKQLEAAEPSEQDDPTRAFERQWATTVLAMAVKRLEAECRAGGTERLWQVFEARLVAQDPVPVEQLVKSLGVLDRTKIHSMVQSAKRKYHAILRDEVARTVDEPAEVDIELANIKKFLAV
ncbi:MAG: sigma-70 family RNA polymerase sigma factor [Vicinamibacterales bacterium]